MAKWLLFIAAISQVLALCSGKMYCWDFLVSGPQGVPDSAITASSHHSRNGYDCRPACGRLFMSNHRASGECFAPNLQSWCGGWGDGDPYIQVKFADLKNVFGVVVQSRYHPGTSSHDIRTFNVLYSINGEDWKYVKSKGVAQTFSGPGDAGKNTEPYQSISQPVVARYIRIRVLTWVNLKKTPCLKFDVIGCTNDIGRRRFAYLPLPAGAISDKDIQTKGQAEDLRICSLRCHRNHTCRSFSYRNTSKQCKLYNINKYTNQNKTENKLAISDKNDLYYFDMAHVDLYMTTDPKTGLIYKVITRNYNKTDAMTACADFEMRLLIVNSEEKLDLVRRIKSSSLILEQGPLRVNGGWYEVNGINMWWDGGQPPQPFNGNLTGWNIKKAYADGECVAFTKGQNIRIILEGEFIYSYEFDFLS